MRLPFPTTARAPSAQKLTTSMNAQQPPSAKSYFRQHSTMQKTSKPSATSYTRSSSANTMRSSPTPRPSNTPGVRRDSGSPPQQTKCTPSNKRYSSKRMFFTTFHSLASATHGQWNAACTTLLATNQQIACPSSSQISNTITPSTKRPTDLVRHHTQPQLCHSSRNKLRKVKQGQC